MSKAKTHVKAAIFDGVIYRADSEKHNGPGQWHPYYEMLDSQYGKMMKMKHKHEQKHT